MADRVFTQCGDEAARMGNHPYLSVLRCTHDQHWPVPAVNQDGDSSPVRSTLSTAKVLTRKTQSQTFGLLTGPALYRHHTALGRFREQTQRTVQIGFAAAVGPSDQIELG